ncbi:phage portal protein [Acidiphilium sp.]|uniref:phage portal protein n=1 Tax=Acidiphilium sp. TaxID=527 RepID=UPI00258CB2AD|nr:phage portal protein [Acidiphilium sp.]
MGYLRNLLNAATGQKPQASTTYDLSNMSTEQIREFLRIGGGGMETASGAHVSESSAMRVAAAWRSVNIISGVMGSLPIDLIRREAEDRRVPAVNHPLRRVLTVKPNQWQTPNEFRRMMQAHLLLRGNAYALKVMAADRVLALIPLHPDRVGVEQLDDYSIEYKVSLKGGQYLRLQQKDVFHLRGMSLDGIKGLSVLSHMRESLGIALQAERTSARLMQNGQFVGGVLSHPGKLSAEAHSRLKASIDEKHAGADNAGKNLLLEEGMAFAPVSMTATDMQFLQQRDFQRYDIAMFFGVPPHMLGATEKTTSWGSGIEQQGIGFVTYTLNDWIKIWEEACKRDLIPEREWDTHDVRMFTQGLMRGDARARWEAHVKGLQWGVISPDEVRALEDMNPRPDGLGGVYYDPPNTAGGEPEGDGDEPKETSSAPGV